MRADWISLMIAAARLRQKPQAMHLAALAQSQAKQTRRSR